MSEGRISSAWWRVVVVLGVAVTFVACGSSNKRRNGNDSEGGEGGEGLLGGSAGGGAGGRAGSGAGNGGASGGALAGSAGVDGGAAGQDDSGGSGGNGGSAGSGGRSGSGGAGGSGGSSVSDPCEGVECSGHGECVASGETARCACDEGYAPQGLECVACSPISGTYDIDVPMVTISGTLSVNGAPVAPLGDALLQFVREEGDTVTAAHLNTAAYSVELLPGTYDVMYSLQSPDAALPENTYETLREGVTLDATGTFDIDIPMVNVSGNLSVNGETVGPAGDAFLYFRRQGELPFASSARFSSPNYTVGILPGIYDIFYASSAFDAVLPNNRFALVLEGVNIEEDRSLDVDVPMVTLSGSVTVNGEPLAAAPETRITLQNVAGDQVDVSVNQPTFSLGVVPGTYDVVYSSVGELDVVPSNGAARLQRGVEISESRSLDIDVPMVTVSGSITVNGEPPPGNTGALLYLAKGTEDSLVFATTSSAAFATSIIPDTYDVLYVAQNLGAEDGLPDNQLATLRRDFAIDETLTFDQDIPMAVVSGAVTVNGEPPPGNADATFFFRSETGDTVIAATLDAATYSAEFVPGTYDVFYSAQFWADVIPANLAARVLSSVNIDGAQTLDLEVPAGSRLSGSVTVNGAPAATSGSAVIGLFREPNDNPELASVSSTDYETLIVPGTYTLLYQMRSPGSGIPGNSRARLGCVQVE